MPQMIAVVGKSDSGKTTLIEKLIPELKARGYKIGIIKHASHGFEMDKKGKDTWRHRQAGADTVIAAAPGKIAMIKSENCQTPDELAPYCRDMDLIIVEGFKHADNPKIEVFRQARHKQPLFRDDPEIIALVTDAAFTTDIPRFELEGIKELADFIESRFLS